jgi:hypothetical protein
MKALSLTQPWATLVSIGAKRIETRSWHTTYRGPLAIHAAKGFPREARGYCDDQPFLMALCGFFGPEFEPAQLPTGAIVGITSVKGCVKMSREWIASIAEPERSFGLYEPGRYGWLLGPVEWLVEPVPVKGSLGLWEYIPAYKVPEGYK